MLTLLVFTHFSCKKETGSVGLQDGDDAKGLIRIDTFTLVTRTVVEDSVRVDNISYNMLGATQDAEFGYNASAMLAAFRLPASNFSFPAGVQIDSVVLQLKYLKDDQYSGNLATPMNIRVHELNRRFYEDSIYYSNLVPDIKGVTQTVFNGVVHRLTDSVDLVENGKSNRYAPHLRLKLGASFVDVLQNASSSNLASNQAFQDYFNGVQMDVQGQNLADGEGNIVLFDLRHSVSGMAVYFNDTGKYLFPIGSDGFRLNLYSHDFGMASGIQAQLNAPGQDFATTYVQSMSGLKTLIEVPHLNELLNSGNYAVVNARFECHFDGSQAGGGFEPFSRMLLVKRNEEGRNDFVVDQVLEAEIYGGSLDDTEDRYVFNISREIQDILNNSARAGFNKNTGFFLIAPTDGPVTASHLKMDMSKGGSRGIKLILTLVRSN